MIHKVSFIFFIFQLWNINELDLHLIFFQQKMNIWVTAGNMKIFRLMLLMWDRAGKLIHVMHMHNISCSLTDHIQSQAASRESGRWCVPGTILHICHNSLLILGGFSLWQCPQTLERTYCLTWFKPVKCFKSLLNLRLPAGLLRPENYFRFKPALGRCFPLGSSRNQTCSCCRRTKASICRATACSPVSTGITVLKYLCQTKVSWLLTVAEAKKQKAVVDSTWAKIYNYSWKVIHCSFSCKS